MQNHRIVRESERASITGVPTSTWYDLVESGLAPPAVKVGKRAAGWPESELFALNNARIACKTEDQIRSIVQRLLEARSRAFDQPINA